MATKPNIIHHKTATKTLRFSLLSTATCVQGRQIKNTNTKKRMGWVTAVSEMSHPPLRAVISPERDERWSLEQRSPFAPIQSLAPAKQHHIPRALSLSAALSFLPPLRRKQLRINLNLSKSPTAYWYFVELHRCDQIIHISDAWLQLMKADSIRQCSMCFICVPEDMMHIFLNKQIHHKKEKLTFCRLVGFNWVLSMIFIATWKRHQGSFWWGKVNTSPLELAFAYNSLHTWWSEAFPTV